MIISAIDSKNNKSSFRRLSDALAITPEEKLISIIGAGGKTSIIYQLAEEFRADGQLICITTTTHILPDRRYPLLTSFKADNGKLMKRPGIYMAGQPDSQGKLTGLRKKSLHELSLIFDRIIVEADGSKQLPLKLPAPHEPQIAPGSQLVIITAGADALGNPIEKICHRPEIVSTFLGKSLKDNISEADIAIIFPAAAKGGSGFRQAYVLNKINSAKELKSAIKIHSLMKGERLVTTGCSPDSLLFKEISSCINTTGSALCAIQLAPDCGHRCLISSTHPLYPQLADSSLYLPCTVESNGIRYYAERIYAPPILVIAGAGHVGRAVSRLGAFIGMDIIIIDDRPEAATRDSFPMAKEILCGDISELLQRDFGPGACYVVATHGHQMDLAAVNAILKHSFRYLGMIGSRNKVAANMASLKELGWQEDRLKKIHAPIGLRIGAITPEEIAVSIMAEIIQVINTPGCDKNMPDLFALLARASSPAILATIVSKDGSSPRGKGSRMLIDSENIWGTVGGGRIELEVIKDARELLSSHQSAVKEYFLTAGQPGSLGMACNGRITCLLEYVSP